MICDNTIALRKKSFFFSFSHSVAFVSELSWHNFFYFVFVSLLDLRFEMKYELGLYYRLIVSKTEAK